MIIIVEKGTNKIVGTATKNVSVSACEKNGQKIYEIPDNEFHIDMLGSILKSFDADKNIDIG